jgi:hypothetical protein
MNNTLFELNKSLSIVELEDRQELTVVTPTVDIEASKGNDNDTTIIRCGGNG